MRKSRLYSTVSAALLAAFVFAAPASAQAPASLSGAVTSQKEGAMEGVIVTVKKGGSNINVSVITDDKGREVVVPSAKVAYVEFGAPEGARKLGFGS